MLIYIIDKMLSYYLFLEYDLLLAVNITNCQYSSSSSLDHSVMQLYIIGQLQYLKLVNILIP